MSLDRRSPGPKGLAADVNGMKIEDETKASSHLYDVPASDGQAKRETSTADMDTRLDLAHDSVKLESPRRTSSNMQSPAVKSEKEEIIGGNITLKMEPGEAPRLSRKQTQKVPMRAAQLYAHLDDATADAKATFEVLKDCSYAAKYLGYTEPPLECDCSEEWNASTQTNDACGEDSDCINRATKMECDGDCGCGTDCQNQRFQRKQYANVSVIKTDKKGFGLRANTDLKPNDFIFEYIGEVIGEPAFRRRMRIYDEEGVKHFYFMSLAKGEFVDATKKGNLGRFCNHSCNPNCYVDKWVVGEKLRMGIFAERAIKAGEELVFNYNVDRYGADPQPCYCGEPNCVGFIGGKTQTGERATQLSFSTVEALGLEDADDWDTAVAKRPRKRKTGEADEEYVNNVQPKELDSKGAAKVLASLGMCKEKWIAVKLLDRIQQCEDENVRYRIIKMHGYRILAQALKNFLEDNNICLQICDILARFPKLTRNKIHNSGIEAAMSKLTESEDEQLRTEATSLLDVWSKLEMGFRIQKIKRDPNAVVEEKRADRREGVRERARSRSRSRSKSLDAPRGPAAPTGPRNSQPQRAAPFHRPPPPFRPRPNALPEGWFQAVAQNGSTYYYNATGGTTWQRPTQPALGAPPPPPPKAISDKEALQSLINSIVQQKKETPVHTPGQTASNESTAARPEKQSKEERWKSWPEEKRKKAYENTIAYIINHVISKYKKVLNRDALKTLGKTMSKQLVNSDFKHHRVKDPYKKPDAKYEKRMTEYVVAYFDRAVAKKEERKRQKLEESKKEEVGSITATTSVQETTSVPATEGEGEGDEDLQLSENEVEEDEQEGKLSATPAEGSELKRTRGMAGDDEEEDDDAASKKPRTDEAAPPPPPPPPPPPSEGEAMGGSGMLEAGLTPGEDVGDSFHNGVLHEISNGHVGGTSRAADDDKMEVDNAAQTDMSSARIIEHQTVKGTTPTQVATPPTTGSPEHGEDDRERRRREFSGLNPDRMRALGFDGTME